MAMWTCQPSVGKHRTVRMIRSNLTTEVMHGHDKVWKWKHQAVSASVFILYSMSWKLFCSLVTWLLLSVLTKDWRTGMDVITINHLGYAALVCWEAGRRGVYIAKSPGAQNGLASWGHQAAYLHNACHSIKAGMVLTYSSLHHNHLAQCLGLVKLR